MELPLFVKANSIIPLSSETQRPHRSCEEPLTLDIFALDVGTELNVRVAAVNAEEAVFHVQRRPGEIVFKSDGKAKCVSVLLRHCRAVTDVINGRESEETPEGWRVEWQHTGEPLIVAFPESLGHAGHGTLADRSGVLAPVRPGHGQNGDSARY